MDEFRKVIWYTYQHTNGLVSVKKYFTFQDLEDARTSSFVKQVAGPVEFNTREAINHFKGVFKV